MAASVGLATLGDILLVDDTPANLRLLTQVLHNVGYRIRAVTTGRRALSAACAKVPDLILLDVHLPDIDGFELCSLLKANPLTAGVPVIFISAVDQPEAKIGAFASGGVDFVTKPLHPDEVLARVHTHLALRELHLQLQVANEALAERLGELEQSNLRLQTEIGARRTAEELNRHLLEQERQRVDRLHRLRKAIGEINAAPDLEAVHQAIAEQGALLFAATWSALAIAAPGAEELILAAFSGLPPHAAGGLLEPGRGLISLVAETRRIADASEICIAEGALPLEAGVTLAAPLLANDHVLGVVAVTRHEEQAFDDDERQLLDLFAQQAASAVEKARYFAELRQMASTDPLTGLINRRHFYDLSSRELERVHRSSGALALLMLDLDHFKRVNDAFGHQVGDHALQAVAQVFRTRLRAVDVVSRFGGEELVVLLPDTDLAQALQAAERLRAAIGALVLPTERGELRLTASVGVTSIEGVGQVDTLDQLLARADQALYAAKGRGRDCVVAWQAEVAVDA